MTSNNIIKAHAADKKIGGVGFFRYVGNTNKVECQVSVPLCGTPMNGVPSPLTSTFAGVWW